MRQTFENLTIGKKLILGFSFCFLIILSTVLTTVFYVKETDRINTRLIKNRIPTTQNTLSLINGVNHSLAALRGWIILGKDKFRSERELAWNNISNNMVQIEKLSKNWTNPKNIERAKTIKKDLEEFKIFQQEIEDIAHSRENLPATKILLQDAAPKANIMLASITNLINLEMNMPVTKERKNILGMMADTRGTTARALANIRAFLLSGDTIFEKRFNKMWKKNIKRVTDLKSKRSSLSQKQKIEFDSYFNAREKFKNLPKKMFKIRNGNNWNLANSLLANKAAPVAFKIKETLTKMYKDQNSLMQTDGNKSHELISSLLSLEYSFLIIGIISCLLIGFTILKTVNNSLTSISKKVSIGMKEIANLTRDVDDASQALSASSEQQSSSIHETSASMNEISAMVKRNTKDSLTSNNLATESYQAVEKSVQQIKQMSKSLNTINYSNEKVSKQIDESNSKMSEITALIKSIGEKTKVIDDIVFQTKLLSFNASVEAARAGENGKGFAVVAEEVGNLAQMSGDASTEIFQMLESSITSVEKVAQNQKREMGSLISESKSNIDTGAKLSKDSETFLVALLSKMDDLKQSVNQISIASTEQSKGVDEITEAITEINHVTRTNSGISNDTSKVSKDLNNSVKKFNLIIEDLNALVKQRDSAKKSETNKDKVEILRPKKKSTIKDAA